MASHVSLGELKTYLGNFVSNDISEPEFSDITLQKDLDQQALKIKGAWKYKPTSLPTPTGSKETPTWLDLLLEMLTLDAVAAKILARQGARKFGVKQRQAQIYLEFAKYRFDAFNVGRLTPAILAYIKGKPIDTTSFLDTDDKLLTSHSINFTVKPSSRPNIDQVTRFCLRESAWIRAIALSRGFETTKSNLSSDQLAAYQLLLTSLVAPQIARINLSYYKDVYDEELGTSLLDTNPANIYSAVKQLNELEKGKNYTPIFLL